MGVVLLEIFPGLCSCWSFSGTGVQPPLGLLAPGRSYQAPELTRWVVEGLRTRWFNYSLGILFPWGPSQLNVSTTMRVPCDHCDPQNLWTWSRAKLPCAGPGRRRWVELGGNQQNLDQSLGPCCAFPLADLSHMVRVRTHPRPPEFCESF